jgi:ElaB/YqjD/DUF883 family membrane-anchored ribosome-binding protein
MKTSTNTIHATDVDKAPTTRWVASAAHEAIDGIAEKAQPVEQHMRDQASKTSEQLEATRAVYTQQIQQSMHKFESFVKEQPIAASGIAFAAGILAAAILRR